MSVLQAQIILRRAGLAVEPLPGEAWLVAGRYWQALVSLEGLTEIAGLFGHEPEPVATQALGKAA